MPATLKTRRFTVDEYYRMAAVGILDPHERVELIEGEIVQMAAIGSRHAECVDRLARLFIRGIGDRGTVRIQNPVRLSSHSEPEPDVTVVRRRPEGYAAHHPGPRDVLLVVEVAETTLPFDLLVKAPLYATAGIGEYWVVDIEGDRIEAYRQPGDGGYDATTRHGRGEALSPAAFPDLDVAVDEVLPPQTGEAAP